MRVLQWLTWCAPRTAPRALAWYIVSTVVCTWPVAAGLTRDVPHDLGDPLLNSWILGWNATHFLAALRGDVGGLSGMWHANIFHPEPYALAYSELLLAPTVQILPVYALTGNLILSYNLLFLSTYVLSGLGAYLLVRAYVADWRVAFVAGLLFAFTPYRVNQGPHLQVMSSHWMPFVLYGFLRFVETRRWRAVPGGGGALVALNLSCGYFLIFFAPFVPAFVLFEMTRARAWKDVRLWAGFAVAAALVAAVTVPAMAPYTALRELRGTVRPLNEIRLYSADAWGWLTADHHLAFWGPRLRLWVRPEGQVFPGVLPVALTIIGLVAGTRRAWRSVAARAPGRPLLGLPGRARTVIIWLLGILLASASALATLAVTGLAAEFGWIRSPFLRLDNLLIALAVAGAGLTLASVRARRFAGTVSRSPLAFASCAALAAWFLSLGPEPRAGGHQIAGFRVYQYLLETLPGLDGLRVPARFAMIVVLFLSVTAAWGVRDLLARRSAVLRRLVLLLLCVVWLGETWSAPLPMNGVITTNADGIGNTPARVPAGASAPALARYLRSLPDAVLVEFPFGFAAWEVRYVYYSTLHWRRLVNGYSGYSPGSYDERAMALRDPYRDPQEAWRLLVASGATHVVVHGQAYLTRSRPAPYDWLAANGARIAARYGTDTVYEVPR